MRGVSGKTHDDNRAHSLEKLVRPIRGAGAASNQGEQERRGGGDEFRIAAEASV